MCMWSFNMSLQYNGMSVVEMNAQCSDVNASAGCLSEAHTLMPCSTSSGCQLGNPDDDLLLPATQERRADVTAGGFQGVWSYRCLI